MLGDGRRTLKVKSENILYRVMAGNWLRAHQNQKRLFLTLYRGRLLAANLFPIMFAFRVQAFSCNCSLAPVPGGDE